MSVHGVSGKPGGGKSLYGMKLLIEELVYGTRVVVTNLAVELGQLNEYLQREFPNKSINLFERLRVLDDDQVAAFWTFRAVGFGVPTQLNKGQWESGLRPDYSQVSDGGVLYIIDEVHNYFNARYCMLVCRDVLFYLSQHRKMGDDVVLISQPTKIAEAAFMRMCETFYHCRNLSKWKLPIAFGIFRSPALLLVNEYKEASASKPAVSTRTYPIDRKGIGSIYKTAAGVGFVGGEADTQAKPRGLPSWLFVLSVVVIILGTWKLVQIGINKTVGNDMLKVKGQKGPFYPSGPKAVTNSAAVTIEPLPVTIAKQAAASIPKPVEDVYCSGRVKLGRTYRYYLTDGRRIDETDSNFVAWGVNGLILKDGVYKINPIAVEKGDRISKARAKSENNYRAKSP